MGLMKGNTESEKMDLMFCREKNLTERRKLTHVSDAEVPSSRRIASPLMARHVVTDPFFDETNPQNVKSASNKVSMLPENESDLSSNKVSMYGLSCPFFRFCGFLNGRRLRMLSPMSCFTGANEAQPRRNPNHPHSSHLDVDHQVVEQVSDALV